MTDTELKTILKRNLFQLEGVVEGLTPFHPRLGHYMKQRIDEMYRAFYAAEDDVDLSTLSDKPKPGTPEHPDYQGIEPFKHDAYSEDEFIFGAVPVKRRGRPKTMTDEELREKRRQYQRERYQRLKGVSST